MAVEKRFYSLPDFCLIFGFDRRTVKKYIKQGDLKGFRLPGGQWRIREPEWQTAPNTKQRRPADEIFLLKSAEVADLVEVTPRAIRLMAQEGRIDFEWIGGTRRFSLQSVRQAIALRIGGKRGRRRNQRKAIVAWARQKLAK